MHVVGPVLQGLYLVMREAGLFAAVGFLLLGISDLAVDFLWILFRPRRAATPTELPPPAGRELLPLAVFIPAWDESEVIGPMLSSALAAWSGDEAVRLYVGCYPNDPATIAAVRSVRDARVRLVIGPRPGPTTKADCLNGLWRALLEDEARSDVETVAVVLHDAEDVVHPRELGLFRAFIGRYALVQLPVLPLVDRQSRWIGGHYADEFAEAHGKELVVRQAIGAALPSAGVGCAFARDALERIAAAADGRPFDAGSLTEDYELGLRIAAVGGRGIFVRTVDPDSGRLVAVREYFPGTLGAAVRQKGRWMTGIALSGWDRLGWRGGLAERWMRLRDRQTPLAALLLFAGYGAMSLWVLAGPIMVFGGYPPPPLSPLFLRLAELNLLLLLWRLAVRFASTTSAYGWREGARAVPRMAVANLVAMLAAATALSRYREQRRTGRAVWGKTAHRFPTDLAAG
jgi:adsorption protein B